MTEAKTGASAATRYTPAFTIAAAWRYAETGVGAAIAPGSQKWKGAMADLLSAPTSMRRAASVAVGPTGTSCSTSCSRNVPVVTPKVTMPTSIASPPVVVTTRAVVAADRLAPRVESWPMRR